MPAMSRASPTRIASSHRRAAARKECRACRADGRSGAGWGSAVSEGVALGRSARGGRSGATPLPAGRRVAARCQFCSLRIARAA